jgi:hypothetical protein
LLLATHIVGGELNYNCLGNDMYEITLTVYRDCENGNPQAYFDDPAYIGIFSEVKGELTLTGELEMPWLGVDDTLAPILSSECFVVPPNVCVHRTFYIDTLELPTIPGGYTLRYQRCCRNQTIVNIVDPLATGATFSVVISEEAMQVCNSNPKFVNWPPIYICVNEPINFDHSATDVDGDSIVYKLCTPNDGATDVAPYPVPTLQTDPAPVVWVDPPYNESNMLGGDPLTINPQTGLLTGTPNTVGQFVVGVCMEEYRNGVLLSTTRRDFQYNIGICGETTAAFFAPELQCGDLTVDFENQSDNAENYLWYFDVPDNLGATSMEENPSFTYSDTGTYEVMLIIEPGGICADTSVQEVTLELASISPALSYEFVECSDSMVIEITDMSTDSISTLTSWEWELRLGNVLIDTSNDQNPSFTVYNSGVYILELLVTAENGCTETFFSAIPVELIEDIELIADSTLICPGDSIPLNLNPNPIYNYEWSPDSSLSDNTLPNPIAFPDTTTTYSVTVFDQDNFCQRSFDVTIIVPEAVIAQAPPDDTICEPAFQLSAFTNTGVSYFWANDRNCPDQKR